MIDIEKFYFTLVRRKAQKERLQFQNICYKKFCKSKRLIERNIQLKNLKRQS